MYTYFFFSIFYLTDLWPLYFVSIWCVCIWDGNFKYVTKTKKKSMLALKRSNMLILWHCVTQLHGLMLWQSEQATSFCTLKWHENFFCVQVIWQMIRRLLAREHNKKCHNSLWDTNLDHMMTLHLEPMSSEGKLRN